MPVHRLRYISGFDGVSGHVQAFMVAELRLDRWGSLKRLEMQRRGWDSAFQFPPTEFRRRCLPWQTINIFPQDLKPNSLSHVEHSSITILSFVKWNEVKWCVCKCLLRRGATLCGLIGALPLFRVCFDILCRWRNVEVI